MCHGVVARCEFVEDASRRFSFSFGSLETFALRVGACVWVCCRRFWLQRPAHLRHEIASGHQGSSCIGRTRSRLALVDGNRLPFSIAGGQPRGRGGSCDLVLRTWVSWPSRSSLAANQAKVVLAEAEVPKAIAESFRSGNLGIFDDYRLRNIQADTARRETIGESPEDGNNSGQ